MAFPLFLILGTFLMGIALRSFHHPLLHKLGALGVLATSFLIGYFLSGSVLVGLLLVASWFLLPWVEILTHLRRLRLEEDKNLRRKTPPSVEMFPELDELTEEIEQEGFCQVDDLGWAWEEQTQFFRLFYHEKYRTQAAICLSEQDGASFYYLSLSSRGKDGEIWTTWNYPFFYSLKFSPQWKVNRVKGHLSFFQMSECHQEFLESHAVGESELSELSPETMAGGIQNDLRLQISHNLATGLLRKNADGEICYSWRGMMFVCFQFLRESVRF